MLAMRKKNYVEFIPSSLHVVVRSKTTHPHTHTRVRLVYRTYIM